jgi:hypothetical protein
MNPKTLTRFVLLAVVAAAIGAWAFKEFGAPAKADAKAPEEFTRADGVTVINFHGEKRCRSCIRIGTLAEKTLQQHFAAEMQAGDVRWEHINYEAPGNTHYVDDYQLVSSTIVATLWRDGREVKWTMLDDVWDHLDDEAAFDAYLANGIRELTPQP